MPSVRARSIDAEAHGMNCCWSCQYDLRGLSGNRCPECGNVPKPPPPPPMTLAETVADLADFAATLVAFYLLCMIFPALLLVGLVVVSLLIS